MMLGAMSLQAAGTTAGTNIDNTASLTYSAGGVDQTDAAHGGPKTSNTDQFVVDKKIDFIVTHQDNPKHLVVVPGQVDAQREFQLTNQGNEKQDFTFVATNLQNNEVYDGKQDTANADVSNFEYSIDGGQTWSTNPPTIDDLPVGTSTTILVRADVSANASDNDVMNIQLEATAVQDGTTTAEVNTGDGNGADRKTVKDTVLGEGDGVTNFANHEFDGKYSAWAGYIVQTAVLSLNKLSCVITDNVTADATKAKRIPGATIAYVFDVENTGSANADSVTIKDDLVAELDETHITVQALEANTGAACTCDNGSGNGTNGTHSVPTNSQANHDVEVNVGTVNSNNHSCLEIRVPIK